MKKEDIFYLCYGSSIKLLGEIVSDIIGPDDNGWIKRKYKVIKNYTGDKPYYGIKKGWSPNYNSTVYEVPTSDMKLFEEYILIPYFGLEYIDIYNAKELNTFYIKEHTHNNLDQEAINFINTIKSTSMSKSYKIPLLWAFY